MSKITKKTGTSSKITKKTTRLSIKLPKKHSCKSEITETGIGSKITEKTTSINLKLARKPLEQDLNR